MTSSLPSTRKWSLRTSTTCSMDCWTTRSCLTIRSTSTWWWRWRLDGLFDGLLGDALWSGCCAL
eukprot:10963588-Alexandrium_andersonii.AAC.1